MSKEIIERVREDTAKWIFGILHPDTPWGITGTVDDNTWRNEEAFCFRRADNILSHPNIVIIDPTRQAIIDLERLRKLTEDQRE